MAIVERIAVMTTVIINSTNVNPPSSSFERHRLGSLVTGKVVSIKLSYS